MQEDYFETDDYDDISELVSKTGIAYFKLRN